MRIYKEINLKNFNETSFNIKKDISLINKELIQLSNEDISDLLELKENYQQTLDMLNDIL